MVKLYTLCKPRFQHVRSLGLGQEFQSRAWSDDEPSLDSLPQVPEVVAFGVVPKGCQRDGLPLQIAAGDSDMMEAQLIAQRHRSRAPMRERPSSALNE